MLTDNFKKPTKDPVEVMSFRVVEYKVNTKNELFFYILLFVNLNCFLKLTFTIVTSQNLYVGI